MFLRLLRKAMNINVNTGNVANFMAESEKLQRTTVGIIVIGDEILKGSTHDVNSNFMCRRLHARGVVVRKISVVSDEVEDIATEVKDFSEKFDIVFTTGGIGPTHDDRTFAGIAKAFGDNLVLNEELKQVVDRFLRKTQIYDVDEAVQKFCKIPTSAKLIWPQDQTTKKESLKTFSDNDDATARNDKNCKTSDGKDDEVDFREISFLPVKPSAEKDGNNTVAGKGDGDGKKVAIFPSFQVRNVISLPGVPSFCERNFEYLENYLFSSNSPFFSRTLFLEKNEIHLEQKLSQIASDHADRGVSIGSYPIMDNNYFKTKLIVESDSPGSGFEAHNQLSNAFKDYLVNYDETPWENSMEKLKTFQSKQNSEFSAKIDDAIETIDQVLNEYNLQQIALSFNGGKDCTILLHLFRCCVDRRFGVGTTLRGFQVINENEFSEVCDFVNDISKSYKLEMLQVKANLREGLSHLKREHSDIVAVLMGSRRTDPKGRFMTSKCEWTDTDWPRFYRVCPILEWTYSEVWRAIRGLCVPYCRIYDHGYTSLGSPSSTHLNPALLTVDRYGRKRYLAAFQLKDDKLERSSRENSSASLNALNEESN